MWFIPCDEQKCTSLNTDYVWLIDKKRASETYASSSLQGGALKHWRWSWLHFPTEVFLTWRLVPFCLEEAWKQGGREKTSRKSDRQRERKVRRKDDRTQNRGKEKYEASFWEEERRREGVERGVWEKSIQSGATGRDNQSCLTLSTVCVCAFVCTCVYHI